MSGIRAQLLVACAFLLCFTCYYLSIYETKGVGGQARLYEAARTVGSPYEPQYLGIHEARLGEKLVALRSSERAREARVRDGLRATGETTVKQEALRAAAALFEGDFVEDPDFFFSECLRRDAPNLCDLVTYKNDSGVWRAEGSDTGSVSSLRRWVPSKPHPACPFRYFSQKDVLELFREMGIGKVHLMGDSMSRYFGFIFIGVLTQTPREQHTFHFDFNMERATSVGIAVEFYWRETIESLHAAMDGAEAFLCDNDDSLVVINNNLHQALMEQELFLEMDRRYAAIKGVVEHARQKCGNRVMWRGPNQVTDYARPWRGEDKNNVTFAEFIDMDALKVLPRLTLDLDVPLFDVHAITDKAGQDSTDGMHYNRWELEHEVHLMLNQVECLYRTGFW